MLSWKKRATKTKLAKRMKISRAQLDQMLDPNNKSVTLGTYRRRRRTSTADGIDLSAHF
jgi:antitoxin HicB